MWPKVFKLGITLLLGAQTCGPSPFGWGPGRPSFSWILERVTTKIIPEAGFGWKPIAESDSEDQGWSRYRAYVHQSNNVEVVVQGTSSKVK